MEKIKINFKQPKYILPAILYPLLLATGYFFIDMFHTKKADLGDPSMQVTEYLNPYLPQPKVKDDLGGKYENMLRSYGRIDDLTAVDNIDREDKDADKEEYESKYSDDERQAIDDKAAAAQERDKEMEEQIRQSAARAAALQQQGGDYPFPLTESERLIQSQQREQALREELEAALAQLREQSAAQVTGSQAPAAEPEPQRAVSAPEEDDPAMVVRRVRQSSDYFHTVSENDPQPDLIKAIIDGERPAAGSHQGDHRRGHQGRGRQPRAAPPARRRPDRKPLHAQGQLHLRHHERLLIAKGEGYGKEHPPL